MVYKVNTAHTLLLSVWSVASFSAPVFAHAVPTHNTGHAGPATSSHPVLRAAVCNASGNYPENGATSSFVNFRGHRVLVLNEQEDDCTFVGGVVDVPGFPANYFTCTITGELGDPFFSIVVNEPGVGNVVFTDIPVTIRGGNYRADLTGLGLPRNTRLLKVYVWDESGPFNEQVGNFKIDGVDVLPAAGLVQDCTGTVSCGSK